MNKSGTILFYTILAYIISLFLKDAPVATNIMMATIFVLAFIFKPYHQIIPSLLKNRIDLYIIIFYILLVFSLIYSSDKIEGFHVLNRRLPLFMLPLAISLIDFEQKTWHKVLFFYLIITVIASSAGFIYAIRNTLQYHDTGYLYNDNISVFLFRKQAVSFAFYVGIAILINIQILLNWKKEFEKHLWFIYLSLIWLLFILFMLACRTALISILAIILWIIFSNLFRKRKYFEIGILAFGMIISTVIILHSSPKTLNRFKGMTEFNFNYDNHHLENHFNARWDSAKWNSTNTRLAIWECGLDMWKSKPFFGTGIGDRDVLLMKKYEEKHFWYAIASGKNTHNQYIEVGISLGIVGIIIFLLFFFILPIRLFIKRKQTFAIAVFLFFACCLLTENLMDRYQAETIIAFILPVAAKIIDLRTSTS
jgi:O-antigen ligase